MALLTDSEKEIIRNYIAQNAQNAKNAKNAKNAQNTKNTQNAKYAENALFQEMETVKKWATTHHNTVWYKDGLYDCISKIYPQALPEHKILQFKKYIENIIEKGFIDDVYLINIQSHPSLSPIICAAISLHMQKMLFEYNNIKNMTQYKHNKYIIIYATCDIICNLIRSYIRVPEHYLCLKYQRTFFNTLNELYKKFMDMIQDSEKNKMMRYIFELYDIFSKWRTRIPKTSQPNTGHQYCTTVYETILKNLKDNIDNRNGPNIVLPNLPNCLEPCSRPTSSSLQTRRQSSQNMWPTLMDLPKDAIENILSKMGRYEFNTAITLTKTTPNAKNYDPIADRMVKLQICKSKILKWMQAYPLYIYYNIIEILIKNKLILADHAEYFLNVFNDILENGINTWYDIKLSNIKFFCENALNKLVIGWILESYLNSKFLYVELNEILFDLFNNIILVSRILVSAYSINVWNSNLYSLFNDSLTQLYAKLNTFHGLGEMHKRELFVKLNSILEGLKKHIQSMDNTNVSKQAVQDLLKNRIIVPSNVNIGGGKKRTSVRPKTKPRTASSKPRRPKTR